MEYLELFKAVLAAVFTGAGIGIMAYMSKAAKGESFDGLKLAKTGFIGGVVGVVMHLTGQAIDGDNYQAYIAANAGVIYMLDKLWSFMRNAFKARVSGTVPAVMIVLMVFMVSGCASLGGDMVTPKTDGEKLAYTEATLTGLTIMVVQLNEARLLPLDKVKDIEAGITKAELAIRLGRVALVGKDAKTVEEQLAVADMVLRGISSFVESKREAFLSRALPPAFTIGDPKPIEQEVH